MSDFNNQEIVRRAALPEVLFAPDIAIVMELSVAEAEAGARKGLFGPQFLVKGRPAVLRQDFIEFLTLRAASRDAKEVLP